MKNGWPMAAFLFLVVSCASHSPRPTPVTIVDDLEIQDSWSLVREEPGGRQEYQSPTGEHIWLKTYPDLNSVARLKDFVSEKRKLLTLLESPRASPYYGVRPPGPTCTPSNLPPPLDGVGVHMQSLFATTDFVYGACSVELDVYKSQILWINCRNGSASYELRYFYPARSPWRTSPVARCHVKTEG